MRLATCGKSRSNTASAATLQVDARVLRRGLLDNCYVELPMRSEHAVAIDSLPPIHKDPFDRMLVAQANAESFSILSDDAVVRKYAVAVL